MKIKYHFVSREQSVTIVYVVDAGAQETFATICTKIILWISNKRYWDAWYVTWLVDFVHAYINIYLWYWIDYKCCINYCIELQPINRAWIRHVVFICQYRRVSESTCMENLFLGGTGKEWLYIIGNARDRNWILPYCICWHTFIMHHGCKRNPSLADQ